MRNAIALFRVLAKNSEMPRPKEGSRGRLYTALGIIALSCIMIPCCLIVGYISYVMCYALINVSAPVAGLQAEIHIMSAFSMIFGFLVIFNVLYFSSDREHLVPLPFKSEEILAAKFAHSYMAESVMEFLILISMFIGFFIAFIPEYGISIFSVLSGLVAIILIPLLPLTYCAILCLILMAILKGIKNGKILNHVSTLVFLAFVALFLLSFRGMEGITVDNYVDSLANSSNLFTNVLDKFFFTVPILLTAIETNNILYLLLYIVANLAVVAVMLLLGKYLYLPGLYTVASLGNGRRKSGTHALAVAKTSPLKAYLKKEFRVLLRTRAYATNCVFINLLWPFGIGLFFLLNQNKEMGIKLLSLYHNQNARIFLLVTIAVILVSFIATAMNSVAATAFTREGAHLSLIKYIPVPYKTQLLAKGLVSLIISYPPLLLTIIITGVFLGFSPLWYIYYAVIAFAAVIITTMIGLYLDSSHPHSSWDDEYSALRGNLNTFFDMAIIMVASVLVSAIGFLLFSLTGIGIIGVHIFFVVVLLIGAAIAYSIMPKKIIQNMSELY